MSLTTKEHANDYNTHPRWKKCRFFFHRYEEELHKDEWLIKISMSRDVKSRDFKKQHLNLIA